VILQANGRPARKRIVEVSANPTLFAFLMTGDPMQLFSSHGLVLACRACHLPVQASNGLSDGTWVVECGCTEWRCASAAARQTRLTTRTH
jgi:hypothetical protein